MARRVFFSFHYVPDNWRTGQVRNINAVTNEERLTDNKWESVRKQSQLAITRWINGQIRGTSCTIVLIGEQTASSGWVDYEIRHSWAKDGQGLLGIRIHKLLDYHQQPSRRGSNPFDNIEMDNGLPMSNYVNTYDPPGRTSKEVYDHIATNIASWVETAISMR